MSGQNVERVQRRNTRRFHLLEKKQKGVYRKHLIEDVMLSENVYHYIIMEAQAGQGKTTTALQFTEKLECPFFRYQIADEAYDPIFLLSSLVVQIESQLLKAPLNVHMLLQNNEVKTDNLTQVAQQLMDELDTKLKERSVIIIDDLHLLLNASESLNLIDQLLEFRSSSLSFLVLTREQIPLSSKQVRFGGATLYLTNDDLAFSIKETLELFSQLQDGSSLSAKDIETLLQKTEGWPMGMILAGERSGMGREFQPQNDVYRYTNRLDHYFRNEIIQSLPEEIRFHLLRLSLVDDFSIVLAKKLTNDEFIEDKLWDLVERNRFIRVIEGDTETFCFHHLLRESLCLEAHSRLSENDIREILLDAITFHLNNHELEKSLIYALRLGDMAQIEKLLESFGLELVARNRQKTLQRIVVELNGKKREQSGWVQLFEGIITAEINPQESFRHIEKAANLFRQNRCNHGKLLAVSYLIYNHFLSSAGSTEQCLSYLEEATDLFSAIEEEIPQFSRIFVSHNIGIGFIVFFSDFAKSRFYLDKAVQLSQRELPKFKISSSIFIGYSYVLTGDTSSAYRIAESLYSYLKDDIGSSTRIIIHHYLADILSNLDDYTNFVRHRNDYCQESTQQMFKKNIFGPSITLWEIRLLINRDRLEEAKTLVDQHLDDDTANNSAHIRSRFLGYKAYLASLMEPATDCKKISKFLDDALSLREGSSWKGFFMVQHLIIAGITFSLSGQNQSANEKFEQALQQADRMNLYSLLASGYMFRAFNNLHNKDPGQAVDDLRQALVLMRKKAIDTFWGWHPRIMNKMLAYALENDIEPDYVKKLLRTRLGYGVGQDGTPIPLIKIHDLGTLHFSFDRKDICQDQDLSPKQREVLSLIIASPGLRVSQERLQFEMWPDIPMKSARRNFDTLISRFRAFIKPKLSPHHINNYLLIKNGIVSLQNCTVSSHRLLEFYDSGMKHVAADRWWQAGNDFYRAHQLWMQKEVDLLPQNDPVHSYYTEVAEKYRHLCTVWSGKLFHKGQADFAEQLLENALQIAPDNREVAARLYHHFIGISKPRKAAALLARYEKALQVTDITNVTREEILSSFHSYLSSV